MTNIYEKLRAVQVELHAPKNQTNKFGGYNYRSCEDILEAVKPVLDRHGLTLTISDTITEVGGRIYVVATSSVSDGGDDSVSVTGWAREPESQKGMAEPQLTGSASSYSRKYSLSGLFAIDDNKDADTDEHEKVQRNAPADPAVKLRQTIGTQLAWHKAPPEAVKAKISELGYAGLSKIDDPAVLENLLAWVNSKAWEE